MTIYIYVKTHRVTGLKYLGMTTKADPYTYKGSGYKWTSHLKDHGNNVETEILQECKTKEEAKYWGQYYSNMWGVAKSSEWANLTNENNAGRPPKDIKDRSKKESQLYHFVNLIDGREEHCTKPEFYKKYRSKENKYWRREWAIIAKV